jgi:hypothetical protein
LIRDLKQRDMLKDTLIVWAGEFGRTPMSQDLGTPLRNPTQPLFLAEAKSTTDRTDFTDASDSCHPCHPWSNPFGCGRRPHRSTAILGPMRTSSQLP